MATKTTQRKSTKRTETVEAPANKKSMQERGADLIKKLEKVDKSLEDLIREANERTAKLDHNYRTVRGC